MSAFKLLERIHFLGTETLHGISVTDLNHYGECIIALHCVSTSVYSSNNRVEILFICLVAINIASSEKVSSSLPPIFATELCFFFIYSGSKSLWRHLYYKYLLHSVTYLFTFLIGTLWWWKFLIIMYFNISIEHVFHSYLPT